MLFRRRSPCCVDASVVSAVLLPEPISESATRVWDSWTRERRRLLVPPHFGAEVLGSVRRAVVQGRISQVREDVAVEVLVAGILPRVRVQTPSVETWRRAVARAREMGRANTYDTLYLALAEEAGAEFWTADENLIRALTAGGQELPEWVHPVRP